MHWIHPLLRRLPLLVAAAACGASLVPELRAGAADVDVEARDSDGQTALHKYAVYDWGSLEDVKILAARGANLNAADNDDFTPLHLAAMSGFTDKARLLVDKGANVNAVDKSGRTPLHRAADARSAVETLKFLLRKGADRAAKDSAGKTPLDLATKAKNEQAIPLLQ